MASKEEVVYNLLGISVSEYAEINVYFDEEIIHLEKSGNYLCEHCSIRFKTAFDFNEIMQSTKLLWQNFFRQKCYQL